MVPSAHLLSFRHRAAWLLACGLLAMAMQVFGATGLTHQKSAAGGFYAEICTSMGLSKTDPARQSGNPSLPHSAYHDCCKLCAASMPLLTVDAMPGVPPAPTIAQLFFESGFIRPADIAWVSHPPRGPPTA
jgi:hypothetical protein